MMRDVTPQYDASFFGSQAPGSRKSAAVVVPLVNKLVRPNSVLDVGCGVGTWLAEWVSEGVTDVLGLDGEYAGKAGMQIESTRFLPADLRNSISVGRRFDLVESLEVAEHIDEAYADIFVESLVSHADTVLFSAAIPGQTGRHHVNEQWPSYWIEKFAHAGLKPFDVVRPLIWANPRIEVWYRQNILLFSRNLTFDVSDTCVDVVHPELWGVRQDDLRLLVRSLPAAATSALRKRLAPAGRRR
jgi:SAM-dependent methyltransferase